jgi:predicted DNA-binding protein
MDKDCHIRTISLPNKLDEAIKLLAKEENRTVANYIKIVLMQKAKSKGYSF